MVRRCTLQIAPLQPFSFCQQSLLQPLGCWFFAICFFQPPTFYSGKFCTQSNGTALYLFSCNGTAEYRDFHSFFSKGAAVHLEMLVFSFASWFGSHLDNKCPHRHCKLLSQRFFNTYARNAPGRLQFVLWITATCYSGKLDSHLFPSCFPWCLWIWVFISRAVLCCTFALATFVLCVSAPLKQLNFKFLARIAQLLSFLSKRCSCLIINVCPQFCKLIWISFRW